MKYKVNIDAGGIFSKYLNVIQNLNYMEIYEDDEFYINITDNRTNFNMFDFIFEQNLTNEFLDFDCIIMYPYTLNKEIEYSPNYSNYKKILNKFKLKESLVHKINYFKEKYQITKKTVGIHIRLTDMGILHNKEYGSYNFENYLQNLNPDNEYFVASDNEESIEKLRGMFGDKIKYLPNFIRGKTEVEDMFQLQLDNFRNPFFWEEAFIEMFLLSECGSLICSRCSNLSNASIIYSETIKNITRV